jgi:hypothetical protein
LNNVRAECGAEEPYMDVQELLAKSHDDLDALFKTLGSGPIPDGEAEGTAIIAPGTRFSDEIAKVVNLFAWQGKVFDAKKGALRNKILPFGINAIVAMVRKDASWLDNKECIVIDYSETSLVASRIRDEIRMLSPGLYLGKVFWDRSPSIHFALKF